MGEARRKKLAGNNEPSNLNWKRTKKMTQRDINEMIPQSMEGLLALTGALSMYKRGIGGLVKTRNIEEQRKVESEPKLISTWAELKECVSETHELEIDVRGCNGFIRRKNSRDSDKDYFENNHYLSTHTFYGSSHEYSTKLLQKCGFNVRLANWDEK